MSAQARFLAVVIFRLWKTSDQACVSSTLEQFVVLNMTLDLSNASVRINESFRVTGLHLPALANRPRLAMDG